MNRRGFIYRLAFIPPLVALQLNSCGVSKSDWELIHDFVRDVREIVLPSGDGIVIEHLHIENFVMTMLRDCFSPEDQKRFFEGQQALDTYCRKNYRNSFETLSKEQQKEIVLRLNTKDEDLGKEAVFLFSKVKAKIIQGFQQSELLMKDMGKYELVPGRYNGYYKIIA